MAFPCVFKIFSYVATFMLGSPLFRGIAENESKKNSYVKLRTSYVINRCYNDQTQNRAYFEVILYGQKSIPLFKAECFLYRNGNV